MIIVSKATSTSAQVPFSHKGVGCEMSNKSRVIFFSICLLSELLGEQFILLLLVTDHPNREQYDQYEQQWRQYEEQMSQKREHIQSRKRALIESQQQGHAATASSQPAPPPQPDNGSIAAPPAPASATSSATYGTAASTQPASAQPMQPPGYSHPAGAAGPVYPMSAPGYGNHMPPQQPAAPYPSPHMGHSVPTGPRFPGHVPGHDTSAYPQANSGPGAAGPRPGFPRARPPFAVGVGPGGDFSENQNEFEQYGDSQDTAVGSQFLRGPRPPFEAAGGRPPFGQRFRGPRPPVAPNEFGMQAPFRPNQPRAGFGQGGPRPGFASEMYPEAEESSADKDDVTKSADQTSDVGSSQFGPRFGGPGFGRGMRPGIPGMGPRAGFPRGPRPVGMMPRPPVAPHFSEETDETTEEEADSWLGNGMQATAVADLRPRGIRPDGPRFPALPTSGFAGRGDIRGLGPRPGDPRSMLRPGNPRAALPGGLRPRTVGLPPWLAGSGRGGPLPPQWGGQNFDESAADEEYDETAENQEGLEEGDAQEEEYGGEEEGGQEFEEEAEEEEEESVGFGSTGFGPRGFPPPGARFGARPPSMFGMERPWLDMRGPRPGFGPRGPGFGPGFRPRAGPMPLMDIRVRAPLPAPPAGKEEQEGEEENAVEEVQEEETEALAEESEQFPNPAEAAGGVGARMPFRPPFPPGPRGFPADHRLRAPGFGGPLPRGGANWPRPGFGERLPAPPGFRGPTPRFPRMPGQQFDTDSNLGYYPEEGDETGFGDVPEEDYLAAEAEQWGEEEQQDNSDPSLKPASAAGDTPADG